MKIEKKQSTRVGISMNIYYSSFGRLLLGKADYS